MADVLVIQTEARVAEVDPAPGEPNAKSDKYRDSAFA
jgi:hypothetical protein